MNRYDRVPNDADRKKERVYRNSYNSKNRERARKTNRKTYRRYRTKIRKFILDFFGSKCVKCGFDNPKALQLDHINGDGYKDRKKRWNWFQKYKWIKRYPKAAKKKYQLLCANCNWIKKFDNNEIGPKRRNSH